MRLEDIRPSVWDAVIEHMTASLAELEFEGEDIEIDWRIGANARKLDRELYAKYGFFKDIILNERFQSFKTFVQENVVLSFDFLLGDPVLPLVTSFAVLFMMYRRVSNDLVALAAAFLLNVNPVYTVAAFVVYHLSLRWKNHRKPKQYRPRKTAVATTGASADVLAASGSEMKTSTSTSSIGSSSSSSSSSSSKNNGSGGSKSTSAATSSAGEDEGACEHLLLGSDIGTLYTAALLSRVGHLCCVLMPADGPPLQVEAAGVKTNLGVELPPIPVRNLSIGKADRYQTLFDILLTPDRSGRIDPAERVEFSPLGCAEDGFASVVMKMCENVKDHKRDLPTLKPRRDLWTLRAGETSLALDASNKLLVNQSKLEQFVVAVTRSQDHLGQYLNSRAVPPAEGAQLMQQDQAKQIFNLATDHIDSVFSVFRAVKTEAAPGRGHNGLGVEAEVSGDAEAAEGVRMLLQCAAVVGSDELTMEPSSCSGLGFAQALVGSGQGAFYPVGGPQRLADYLIGVIRAAGGEVRQGAHVAQIAMEERDGALQATGVLLQDGAHVAVRAGGSVISGVGMLSTLEDYISDADLAKMSALPGGTEADPFEAVESLVEAVPRVQVLFWLSGSGPDSLLSAADFVDFGEVGGSTVGAVSRVWSPSAKDPSWEDRHPNVQAVVVEMPVDVGKSYVLGRLSRANGAGPRLFSASSSSSKTDRQHLEAARKVLQEVYPRALPRVLHEQVVPPLTGGKNMLSLTTDKFAAPLSAHTAVQGLFFCGRDLATAGLPGDVQGGYVAACAVLGYTKAELQQGRNVASDLIVM